MAYREHTGPLTVNTEYGQTENMAHTTVNTDVLAYREHTGPLTEYGQHSLP